MFPICTCMTDYKRGVCEWKLKINNLGVRLAQLVERSLYRDSVLAAAGLSPGLSSFDARHSLILCPVNKGLQNKEKIIIYWEEYQNYI